MAEILEIRGLTKTFAADVQALKEVDITVNRGEFLVLLGLSGSGKSTLLRCLNRLIEPTSGDIYFDQQRTTDLQGAELRAIRRKFGMVYQQFNLINNLSVLVNVISGNLGRMGFWQSVFPLRNKELVSRAKENIARVGLSDFTHTRVKNLSGGQQQRVAIARALMQEPEVILADEPVASLDPATADTVMQYLGKLNKEDGITIICSLHFLSLARKYGSRVVALKNGELVFSGTPDMIDETRFQAIYGEDAQEVEIR
ncbi:MAG: phosphonate ABC transporter ATP-binding protein [Candidatus Cloacimonetes bacterium]|nr:phosphonate ABC transporter ATP-binding protein [Candidatus Cloacimonadota bacterium]